MKEEAKKVMEFLAGRCDWASTQDGKGFSSVDAPLGHALAEKDIWSPREEMAALRLIQKYQKQVSGGSFQLEELLAYLKKLETEELKDKNQHGRLKKRDIVSGLISVAGADENRRIVIKTGYNEEVKVRAREMIGARWDPAEKQWTADFCKENAEEAEGLAEKVGLKLEKTEDWNKLEAQRKAELVDGSLVVSGFSWKSIYWKLQKQQGRPEADEKIFDAVHKIGESSFAMQMTSWNISRMSLGLSTADPDEEPFFARIESLKDEIQQILIDSLPKSKKEENKNKSFSAALDLPEERKKELAEKLPQAAAEKLMPHQWPAIDLLARRDECILADEQGLGKTIEILMALEACGNWPALVICPSIAKLNWRDETKAWLPGRKVHVVGVAKKDTGAAIGEADIIIVNYESFQKVELNNYAALVCDEAQYLKGHNSQRTQSVKEAMARWRDRSFLKKLYLVTGTPVMNRPSELLTLVTLAPGILARLGGFTFFAARYCRAQHYSSSFGEGYWDYKRSGNLEELRDRLQATGCYLRREKKHATPELSAKRQRTVSCEILNREEYDLARDDLSKWLKEKENNSRMDRRRKKKKEIGEEDEGNVLAWMGMDELGGDDRGEALRKIGILRNLAGRGKIGGAIDWIREHHDEKIVVFAYHLEVQRQIAAAFGGALTIDGDQTPGKRKEAIHAFQTDPARNLIICSLKAAAGPHG